MHKLSYEGPKRNKLVESDGRKGRWSQWARKCTINKHINSSSSLFFSFLLPLRSSTVFLVTTTKELLQKEKSKTESA